MPVIKSVKGFKDILPDETGRWQFVENTARRIFSHFGIREIKIPILEKTDLFRRGIGESTDIVEKEMYTFDDRGGESLTLRPEATASIVRAYLEHNMNAADTVTKLFTIGPMFRRERPQKGRFRQFHQIDVEYIGEKDARVDAELIFMLMHFLSTLGIQSLNLELNSLGCSLCRPGFRDEIKSFFMGKKTCLCSDCTRRMETNPLRIFDCKNEACREVISSAPVIIDFLCDDCRSHFDRVRRFLSLLNVDFTINPFMVRGLDYYTNTAFEITTGAETSQNAVTGGGRYDDLSQILGGPAIPGIGFAIGVERLISLLPESLETDREHPILFIAALGDEAQQRAFEFSNALRLRGIPTEMDLSNRSLKSQMKRSDKVNAEYTLIMGNAELETNTAPLRNMESKEQTEIDISTNDAFIASTLRKLRARGDKS